MLRSGQLLLVNTDGLKIRKQESCMMYIYIYMSPELIR